VLHNATVTKLLQFPKPPPLDTIEHTITVSIGSDRFAIKIHAEIERYARQDPSPPGSQCRTLEFRKLAPEREGVDRGGDRSTGPADGPGAEANTGTRSEILQNDNAIAPSPVATVGAQRPNVASRVGKAGKTATPVRRRPRPTNPGRGARPLGPGRKRNDARITQT
jgi:hypothetical protein